MRLSAALRAALLLSLGCGSPLSLPGHPRPEAPARRPSEVMDFAVLYGSNCAGCHGPDGRGGASVQLADPLYLALADDAVLRRVTAEGLPGTAMPAFAQSAGGTLTEAQVEALVRGMRASWAKSGALTEAALPPYAATAAGDAQEGAHTFAVFCASCHGAAGRGGLRASSIVDGTFLALVSDQHLRTTVLVGRPDLGAPDFRANVPGQPMSAADVSDVVAWLASHRLAYPGQPYPSGQPAAGALP